MVLKLFRAPWCCGIDLSDAIGCLERFWSVVHIKIHEIIPPSFWSSSGISKKFFLEVIDPSESNRKIILRISPGLSSKLVQNFPYAFLFINSEISCGDPSGIICRNRSVISADISSEVPVDFCTFFFLGLHLFFCWDWLVITSYGCAFDLFHDSSRSFFSNSLQRAFGPTSGNSSDTPSVISHGIPSEVSSGGILEENLGEINKN